MTEPRKCDSCHKEYTPKRSSSKYCSTQCRSRSYSSVRTGRERIPDDLRLAVLARDEFRCRLCGKYPGKKRELRVDHIVPIAGGGAPLSMDNLWTLCHPCNSGKSDKSFDPSIAPPPNVVDLVLDVTPNEEHACVACEVRQRDDGAYELYIYEE